MTYLINSLMVDLLLGFIFVVVFTKKHIEISTLLISECVYISDYLLRIFSQKNNYWVKRK